MDYRQESMQWRIFGKVQGPWVVNENYLNSQKRLSKNPNKNHGFLSRDLFFALDIIAPYED